MVVKRAKKEKVGSDVPTLVSSGEQGSDRSESGSKQVRSAFGCDACKKRKIKCDEGRVSHAASAALISADVHQLLCEHAETRAPLCLRV